MSLQKKVLVCAFTILFGTGLMACGNNSNNDQGTAFLALGYFEFPDPENPAEPIPVSGLFFNLESDVEFSTGAAAGIGTGSFQTVLIGLENRLATQFIRVQRIDCSYNVVGSDAGFVIPDDSFASSFVIGAQQGLVENNIDNEGDARFESDSEAVRPQVIFKRIQVVSTDIISYLNVNRNSLPDLPYQMTATCRGVGISQAGDVLTTNPVSIPVTFTRASTFNSQADGPSTTLTTGGEEDTTTEPAVTTGNLETTTEITSSELL